jgi:CRP-like cAMP-binding protein
VPGINERSETNSTNSLGLAAESDVVLNAETCPILRDAGYDYKPLERLFGTLVAGQAFGESCVLNAAEGKF